MSVPILIFLGSAIVETDKTNEIPVAREFFHKFDLDGRLRAGMGLPSIADPADPDN